MTHPGFYTKASGYFHLFISANSSGKEIKLNTFVFHRAINLVEGSKVDVLKHVDLFPVIALLRSPLCEQ